MGGGENAWAGEEVKRPSSAPAETFKVHTVSNRRAG